MIKQKKDFFISNSKSLPSENSNGIEFCTHNKINVVDEVQKELREKEENEKRVLKYEKYLKEGSDEDKAKFIQESHKAIDLIIDRYIETGQSDNVVATVSNDKVRAFLERLLKGKYDNLPVEKDEKGVRMNKKKRH